MKSADFEELYTNTPPQPQPQTLLLPPTLSPADEARVVRIQTLVRGRRARKRCEARAGELFRKCWDALSGFEYYYNVRTGSSSWLKPLLLESDPFANLKLRAERSQTAVMTAQWRQQFDEGVAFQQQCAQEKLALATKHRRKIARAMQRWDHQLLEDKQQRREERLEQLKSGNQQLLQDLYDGKRKQNVETIREAAMRGHVDRVRELLGSGFSADAESAMGLTPLLAACQSGQFEAVKLLLTNGADVNHCHVKSGRTALMEAGARTNASVVKELLRYGARLFTTDAHGETVFDGIADPGVRKVVAMACEVWSTQNAPLFPTAFRLATLALALVSKRQREGCVRRRESTRREVASTSAWLQRLLAEAKVQYDEDRRACHAQITILNKLATLEAADARYDAERSRLLLLAQDALDTLCSSRQPRHLTESVVCTILSYCGRHWFDADAPRRTRKARQNAKATRAHRGADLQPTKLRESPEKLPAEMAAEWDAFQSELQTHCQLLRETERQERPDVESGVSRDPGGGSRATLDVCVVGAEHLSLRDPRTNEAIDPFLRVQVVDAKRQEVAGEAMVALRSLLDQREHDEWLVLPPTLRQQLLEKRARSHAARIRLRLTFTHTK
ncbi:hypothetical protein PybrP1_004915, partial [[Pythium] brassicae (nom. inval.)]